MEASERHLELTRIVAVMAWSPRDSTPVMQVRYGDMASQVLYDGRALESSL